MAAVQGMSNDMALIASRSTLMRQMNPALRQNMRANTFGLNRQSMIGNPARIDTPDPFIDPRTDGQTQIRGANRMNNTDPALGRNVDMFA